MMLFFSFFRGQFISLGEVVQSHLDDPVVDATFSKEVAPLLYPSWHVTYAQKDQLAQDNVQRDW